MKGTLLTLTLLLTLLPVSASDQLARLERENARLRDQIELLNYKNSGLASELAQRELRQKKAARELKKTQSEIKELRRKNEKLTLEQQQLSVGLKERTLEVDALRTLRLENEAHLQTIALLEAKNKTLSRELAQDREQIKLLNARVAGQQLKNKHELTKAEIIAQDHQERERILALASKRWQSTGPQRRPASVLSIDWRQKLKDWAQQYPRDYQFDASRDSVLILADKDDLFKKASSTLEERTKILLHRAARFLSELKQSGQLSAQKIEVIGHASPSYRGRPITPEQAPLAAQKFNQQLSLARANAAKLYLQALGSELPRLEARGASFNHPIGRTLATATEDQCGEYDCALSRRLEIKIYGTK